MRRLLLIVALMAFASCVPDPEPICNIPSVSLGENGKGYRDEGKGEEGELMRTSVRLYGISTVPAGAKITEKGFLVGESAASLEDGTAKRYRVAEETDNFSSYLTDLTIDHTYYFSAYVADGSKTKRSGVGSFHTKAEGYALVTGLTRTGDSVKAEIRDNGGSAVKRVGFCWSASSNPDVFDEVLSATLDKDNSFTAPLPFLESGKEYHFRAFADNGTSGNRISYSDDLTISIEKEKSTIVLSTNDIVLDSEASSFELEINHNVEFTIDLGDCSWIHEVKTKALQTSAVSFSVDENTGVEGRAATIVVRSEDSGLSEEVTVTQMQKDALVIAKGSYTVGQEGGSISIKVGHNVDFTVDIEGDWISQQSKSKAYVDEELKFDIAENPTNDNREGRIIFTSSDKKITQEVKIYQAQTNALVVSETDKVFGSEGGLFDIEVKHNVSFTVDLGGCRWIHEVKTKAMKTSTVSFSVDENTGVDGRAATIVVRSEDSGLSEEVTVTQMQKDALVIAKDSYTVGSEGGSISIKLGHNVDFTVDIEGDWINQQSKSKAYVDEELKFDIAENPTNDNREGRIIFTSSDKKITQEVKVYQAQTNALVVSEKDKVFGSEGGLFDIEVKHNVSFTVDLGGCSWIHEVKTKALQTSTMSFNVDENTGVDGRTATIIVRSEDSGLSEEVTVTQMQKDALVIAKDSYTVGQEGGSISIKLGHNVDFTVDIEGDWISQQPKMKSFVEEELVFNIDENKESESREGTITFKSGDGLLKQTITVSQEANVFNINIPDPVFKAYCVENFDKNGDGEISNVEALSVERIDAKTENVYSLEGIEHFTNLQRLMCEPTYHTWNGNNEGKLSSLDLHNNTNLKVLDCSNNHISALNVQGLHFLDFLDCGYNNLINLDISSNENLLVLDCQSNLLTTLDVTQNTLLYSINFEGNEIHEIDVNNNKELLYLYVSFNPLSALDISNNILLDILICRGNLLKEINVSNNVYLQDLECHGNPLESIDISHNPMLRILMCEGAGIKSIDLSNNSNLEMLHIYGSQITHIDVSNLPLLEFLCITNAQLSTIDISHNPELVGLDVNRNKLTELDVRNNSKLVRLSCQQNMIEKLDLSNNTMLEEVVCNDNHIKTIMVANNPKLSTLFCENNNLSNIDLSNTAALTYLVCNNNQISSLSFNNNLLLYQCECAGNLLTSLDVSRNLELIHLRCWNNPQLNSIWLKQGQIIPDFDYDPSISTIYYK